ncbi:MAG: 50S ribosomal protein L19 [bacterium]
MANELKVTENWLAEFLAAVRPGQTVKVHQRIKELNTKGEEKTRVQIFEGIVLAHKGGSGKSATITVRKVSDANIGVERIFPVYSPSIAKMEVSKVDKVRRAKLFFLRDSKKTLKEKKTVKKAK